MDDANPFRVDLEADAYSGTWVPVGQLGGWVGPARIAVLFPHGLKETLLASADWPLQFRSARPEVWEVGEGRRESRLHPQHARGDVPLEPLVVYFDPPDRTRWLEPVQAFVLHVNAAPRHQSGGRIAWEIRDEDGRPEEVARWLPEGDRRGRLEVRRDQLFEFMRDFNLDLAIFFEENREVEGVEDGQRDEGREELRYWRYWSADVGDHVRAVLRVVTVIERPPVLRDDPEAALDQTLEYVIGMDPKTGEPERLSYPGPPHEKTAYPGAGDDNFLTPVFFRREVLNEYLNDPKHYTVSKTEVSAGDVWSLPIAITEQGNVQIWLGDLGRISEGAQRHFQRFNIADDDAVPDWRIRRDLAAEWVKTPEDEAVDQLWAALRECNEAAVRLCGQPLYAEVGGMNRERLEAMHVPLNSSLPAFQHQVTSLAILVADHLNSGFFDAVGAPSGQGSLNRLAEWLEHSLRVSRDEAREKIGGLYAVQAIRSSTGAHRVGDDAIPALERAGIDRDELPTGFERLVAGATEAIRNVTAELRGLSEGVGDQRL